MKTLKFKYIYMANGLVFEAKTVTSNKTKSLNN